MALFAISDLHLSINAETNKSMEKFGNRWCDYMQKIKKRWFAVVSKNDTVVIPGDISWAMTLEEALDDFKFIDSLPGKKLIGKGNHDFWWSTVSKMKAFLSENNVNSIEFLYNNAYSVPEGIICGSRGWFVDEKLQNTVGDTDFRKIAARETIRFEISLKAASELADAQEKSNGVRPDIFAFLHFPPVWSDFYCDSFIELFDKYSVNTCFYGHIHGDYSVPLPERAGNTALKMISSDFLDFYPYLIDKSR